MEQPMRIAISGTHFVGKSTMIDDFIDAHPEYRKEVEPYYKLQELKSMELALEPSLDSLIEQLDYSFEQIDECANVANVIFDRCSIDYLAYAMALADLESFDFYNSEIMERIPEIQRTLEHLDIIAFLPLTQEHPINYTEENPVFRKKADFYFKKIYRDEILDIFPRYGHPKIIEISGDRRTRVRTLESYLTL
jgi:hypothetical protein